MGRLHFPRSARCRSRNVGGVASHLLRWLILFALEGTAAALGADARRSEPQTAARYLGAASCSSSSCHGGAGERRNQFIVWSQRDFHTKASLILTNARSVRIAQSLQIDNAPISPRCTVCHSPLAAISQVRLAHPDQRDAGVSCETCHGPAESWLRSHTRRDYTYAMRVSSGLHDLRNIYVRANTCVACHQVVEKDVLAAGHPPMLFELVTQMKSEPPHWRENTSSVKAWLTGQAVALRELCWYMSREANADSAPETAAQRAALAWLLARVTAADTSLPGIREDAEAGTMQRAADELARRSSVRDFDTAYGGNLVRLFSSYAGDFRDTNPGLGDIVFYRAKRVVLALEAVNQPGPPYSSELRQLIQDVALLSGFDSKAFAQHLESLHSRLDAEHR
jgi:hypothetical protein